MNFGKTIQDLRKQKNVTQDEMAAELGVTAAAVSKWENGYTLPDILMLCALADYFQVTTDELLGRNAYHGLTIIAADTLELGNKIKAMAAKCGVETQHIYDNYADAIVAVACSDQITHLLIGLHGSNCPDIQFDINCKTLRLSPEIAFDIDSKVVLLPHDEHVDLGAKEIKLYISVGNTDQDILDELRNALQNNT